MERLDGVKTSFLGKGTVELLGPELQRMGVTRALVVTDRFLYESGAAARVGEVLARAGAEYAVFYQVRPNPTVQVVEECAAAIRGLSIQLLVALGGGSAIDTAKAASILAANGGRLEDYEGKDKSRTPGVPIAVVNTTAATGMDALTHAIEATLSREATPITDKDALWAVEQIVKYLSKAVADGGNEEARSMMAYAQYVAGMGFSNAGLGMVHAMAHALGGQYNLPHGVCNAVLLPYVLSFHLRCPVCQKRLVKVARAMGLEEENGPAVIAAVQALNRQIGIPARLSELKGVDPVDFPNLSALALQDICMASDQLAPAAEEVTAVYLAAYNG